MTIRPEPFESIDNLIRRLSKGMQKASVVGEWRAHETFVAKSAKRRSKPYLARARQAKYGKHFDD